MIVYAVFTLFFLGAGIDCALVAGNLAGYNYYYLHYGYSGLYTSAIVASV